MAETDMEYAIKLAVTEAEFIAAYKLHEANATYDPAQAQLLVAESLGAKEVQERLTKLLQDLQEVN